MPLTGEIGPFSSAIAMRRALKLKQISASELLELHLKRVAKFDASLNSIVVKDFERAQSAAREADKYLAAGDERPLLGVPITIKESLDVEGLPSTAGVEARRGHAAARDSRTVARIRAAGAVILGKTNVCTWLADYQSDNPVYGRTNNPWNLSRTSGGSSGGSATVAAGLAAIDIGSDLGGSIRVPPAFCGLWGHRPSDTAVCSSGHFPGSDYPNVAVTMAIQGPQARSAHDCEVALDVMAGPDVGMDAAWKLNLPPARHDNLRAFRIAALPAPSWLPVDSQIVNAFAKTVEVLKQAGATVQELAPPLGDLRHYYALFRSMMAAIVSVHWPAKLREQGIDEKLSSGDEFMAADARGLNATSAQYIQWHELREKYRCAWRSFFEQWDILLTPMTLTPAFKHTSIPTIDRMLDVGSIQVPFDNMSFYPGLPTLAGHPATAFPAGFTSDGLPIGLQAIGPFLEDRTPLRFAQFYEDLTGGFRQPTDFAANTF